MGLAKPLKVVITVIFGMRLLYSSQIGYKREGSIKIMKPNLKLSIFSKIANFISTYY